jgi:hypothetical protein
MNLIFHDLFRAILEIYIDDVVIKSVGFREHMANLKVSSERMRKYGLRMNPMKCAFGVSVGRFMGFIVHEHGIQIGPKKVESINRMEEHTCKRDMQKLLGKVNYLMRFIANLDGKIGLFMPLLKLKHKDEFAWGRSRREPWKKSKDI